MSDWSLDDLHGFHILLHADQMGLHDLGTVVWDFHDGHVWNLNVEGLGMWGWNRLLLRDLDRMVHFRSMYLEKFFIALIIYLIHCTRANVYACVYLCYNFMWHRIPFEEISLSTFRIYRSKSLRISLGIVQLDLNHL